MDPTPPAGARPVLVCREALAFEEYSARADRALRSDRGDLAFAITQLVAGSAALGALATIVVRLTRGEAVGDEVIVQALGRQLFHVDRLAEGLGYALGDVARLHALALDALPADVGTAADTRGVA